MSAMKKCLSLLLAMIMCFSLMPTGALAEEESSAVEESTVEATGQPAESENSIAADPTEDVSVEYINVSSDSVEYSEIEPNEEDAENPEADYAPANNGNISDSETTDELYEESDGSNNEQDPIVDDTDLPPNMDGTTDVTRAQWVSALVETFSMTVQFSG